MTRRQKALLLLLAFGLASIAAGAFARVGGGSSYSGGGSSSGNGGGGGDGGGELVFLVIRMLFWLTVEYPAVGIPLDLIVIGGVVVYVRRKGSTTTVALGVVQARVVASRQPARIDQLRRFDPNFSEIVFTDFCYALYARVQNARGNGTLPRYAPYLSDAARASLLQRNPANLQRVTGVIVGAFHITHVAGLETPTVTATIEFETNYTELVGTPDVTEQNSWYVRERWTLERKRDILSPRPEKADAEHCPKCGGALDTRTDGTCAYCGAKIQNGTFQWFVIAISVLQRENRGPLLTSDVPEAGTDRVTIMQPNFASQRQSFIQAHPRFDFGAFDARVRMIATDLNDAWTSRSWERARAHETDNLFQMHRYWIDEYKRQGLRNAVDDFAVARVEAVKITSDAFFDSITVRIFASGRDYTVSEDGNVVSGSKSSVRRWSEYWTFIRGRGATSDTPQTKKACPNCGAPLDVTAAGICNYCGGKITSGEFDWVLSKIEQDESYSG